MQNTWLSSKAEEIEDFARKHDMKNFFSAIKALFGPTQAGSSPQPSAVGTKLLVNKDELLKRWAEHF